MPPKSDKPATCKKCGKSTYKKVDGTLGHERRGDPAVYGGRRADPGAGDGKKPQEPEIPPTREHFLHRTLGGGKKESA